MTIPISGQVTEGHCGTLIGGDDVNKAGATIEIFERHPGVPDLRVGAGIWDGDKITLTEGNIDPGVLVALSKSARHEIAQLERAITEAEDRDNGDS
jgi:hypothetical protein